MAKRNKLPDWYWTRDLHDANIISAAIKESDWDPSDNCLILKIDCKGALFERDITEIRFYKFRILTTGFNMNDLNGGWWLSDELTQRGDRYYLDLRFDTKECKTRRLEIKFQKAEVIRG